MTNTVSDYDKGTETLAQLIGKAKSEATMSRFRELSPAFENEVISVVFGRTWSREGIDPKTRALCSISILAALGRHGALRIVLRIALKNGATVEEITEALLQVGVYAGYPAAFDALPLLAEAVKEMDEQS